MYMYSGRRGEHTKSTQERGIWRGQCYCQNWTIQPSFEGEEDNEEFEYSLRFEPAAADASVVDKVTGEKKASSESKCQNVLVNK